jgi:hypothetical protein
MALHDTPTRTAVQDLREFPPVCEVPCILHTMLHLEESRNKEQRKAGGFNYDILDESFRV